MSSSERSFNGPQFCHVFPERHGLEKHKNSVNSTLRYTNFLRYTSLVIVGMLATPALAETVSLESPVSQTSPPVNVGRSRDISNNSVLVHSISPENELFVALTDGIRHSAKLANNSSQASLLTSTVEAKSSEVNLLPEPSITAQVAPPDETVTPEFSPRVGARFTTQGTGYENGFVSIEGFAPITQTPSQNLTFVEGRLFIQANSALGTNLVVGHRFFVPSQDRVFGGYVAYDNRNTGNNLYNQLGVGLEALSEKDIEFRFNAYFPVGTTRNQIGSTVTSGGFNRFAGNYLVRDISRQFESAAMVLDAEFGGRLTELGDGSLRGYAGLYYLDAQGSPEVVGVKGRLEALPTDYLNFNLSIQNDSLFNTRAVLSVGVTFPGTSPRGVVQRTTALHRMGEPVARQSAIVVAGPGVTGQTENTVDPAINAVTGRPYYFVHVVSGTGGNGTFETPFGTVQLALDESARLLGTTNAVDVIYVQGPGSETLTNPVLPGGVDLISNRIPQQTPDSVLQVGAPLLLPAGTSPGNVYTLTLPASQPLTVTGSGSLISALTFNAPSSAAIQASNVNNLAIRDNTINSVGGPGILTTNVNNLTALNNVITSTNGSGISTNGGSNLLIQNNTVRSNSGGSGVSTNGSSNVTLQTNNITSGSGAGVSTTGGSTFLIQNNTISSTTGGAGVSTNGSSNVTLQANNITSGGGAGVSTTGGSTFLIQNNTISSTTGGAGVSTDGSSNVTLQANNITSGGGAGVSTTGGTTLLVQNNTITSPAGSGVLSNGSNSLTVQNNTINNAGGAGVQATSGTTLTVQDNVITTPTGGGVVLDQVGGTVAVTRNQITRPGGIGVQTNNVSNLTVLSNTITSPGGAGIQTTGGSGITVQTNTITSPAGTGVLASGSSNLSVLSNNITNANGAGVQATNGSTLTVQGNTITTPTGTGVVLNQVGGTVAVTANQITQPGAAGIQTTAVSNLTVQDNVINRPLNGAGIQSTGGSNLTYQGNQITSPTGRGIDLAEVTGQVAVNTNTINGTLGTNNSGIVLNNTTGSVTFTASGNTITNTQNNGVDFTLQNTAQATATFSNNVSTGNLVHGGLIQVLGNAGANGTFNFSNNTISSNTLDGVRLIVNGTNANAIANFTGGTIANNGGGAVGNPFGNGGIATVTDGNATLRLSIASGTQLTGNTVSGLDIQTAAASTTLVNIANIQATGNGANDIFGTTNAPGDPASTDRICLRPNNSTIGTLTLDNSFGGTIQVEGPLPGTNTITTTNLSAGVAQNQAAGTCGFP